MQVKELRQEIGVTQKRLAETSGLDFRWIQKVESGEINMENITVKRFFSLLKGISQCADDCDESRQIQIIREAYRNVHAIADSFNDNLKVTLGIQEYSTK